uniref:Histone H1x n=1 Tax=Geotrypetes seraphini TaxID=260995 RepID=A0A6P8PDE2_GEOSA|nr:histone H1x [Geotrypetes seraphini]
MSSAEIEETVPDGPEKGSERTRASRSGGSCGPPRKGKKKNQPGKYSQLVVDTIRQLGERNGSSLAKIYSEAKQVPWFDQQNGRTYLKYSVKALVQNDTLVQVKGIGANGSFRLNRKKLEGGGEKPAPAPAPAPKKSQAKKEAKVRGKKSPSKAKKKAKKEKKGAKRSLPKLPKAKKA